MFFVIMLQKTFGKGGWYYMLKNLWLKTRELFLSPMFARFVYLGFVNGFTGIFFSYIISFALPVNVSFIIGYYISICLSYILNSFFVFNRRITVERYLKFCLSYVPNFIIQKICVIITYNWMGWHEIASFTLAAFIAAPVTFVVLNLLTFKNAKK